MRLIGAIHVLALLCCGCSAPVPARVASSSSIVLTEDEARLYVASPDDDVVVVIDAASGAELSRFAVPGGPEQLALTASDVLVTLSRQGALAFLDRLGGEPIYVSVPCGSTHAVVVSGERAFVSCPDDDRVIDVDLRRRELVAVRTLVGGPSGLALFGDQLGVALGRAGRLAVLDLSEGSLEGAPLTFTTLETGPGIAASQADVLTADPVGGFVLAFQRVEHDADRDRDPSRGGYGSVLDGAPRIEPRLNAACGDRYARFDGGALAMSGPSAVASRGGLLWIAHRYTDGVVLARCAPANDAAQVGPLDVLTTFRVGRAPRGLALSLDGRTAFVDNGFSWAVSRLDAPSARSARLEATWTRTRSRGPTDLSETALRGRSLFFDAVDTHLTPSGVVTCGTCHPGGGQDALSWFLHTGSVPRKLRRTPPAWGARAELAPFHWDGEFSDAAVLARGTTEALMEGDGLLVDFGAIAAWMAEMPLPSPRLPDDPAAAERGRALFSSSGCDACHSGPLFSDATLHDVIAASDDTDANVAAVSTPSLIGIRARAPYFHDGRARTLLDTLTVPSDTHGRTTALSAAERADLIAYLESL